MSPENSLEIVPKKPMNCEEFEGCVDLSGIGFGGEIFCEPSKGRYGALTILFCGKSADLSLLIEFLSKWEEVDIVNESE